MGPNSFFFAYAFAEKRPRQTSAPPNVVAPPQRTILDSPLQTEGHFSFVGSIVLQWYNVLEIWFPCWAWGPFNFIY